MDLPRDSQYIQTLCRLVTNAEIPHRIEKLGPDISVLHPPNSTERTLVVRYPKPKSNDRANREVVALLRPILTSLNAKADIVLVGADAGARKALKKARPMLTAKSQYLLHLQADGDQWSEKDRKIGTLLVGDAIEDATWSDFESRSVSDTTAFMAEAHAEERDFKALMSVGSIRVTASFLAIATLMYGVEWWLGAQEYPPALVRLGALSAPLILEGELHRLLSVSFLHGSVLHFLFNMYVLYMLGGFVERMTGSLRFTLLFVASVIGGSLTSVFLRGTPLAVGASGGLWGVLTAHYVIAWGGKGVLPKAAIYGARQAALTNLILNIAVSFQPNVDWAAHVGGGIVGGVLMFGLLGGLPKLDEFDASVEMPKRPPLPVAGRVIAFGLGGAMVLALIVALGTGEVWKLSVAPTYTSRALHTVPASVEFPDIMGSNPALSNETEQAFGDINRDPLQCRLMAFPYGDGESYDRATNDASFARFVTSMNTPPPETAMLRQPQRQVAGENVGVFAQYAFANGLLLESAVVMLQAGVVRLDCVTWPEVGAFAEVPAHAAGSLRWQ